MGSSTVIPNEKKTVGDAPVSVKVSGAAPTKILIIDDEPDILDEVSECLGDEGYEWVTAQNADDALRLVESDHDIGIVVTDIRMPGMGGLDLSRKLIGDYGSSRDLFVIVVTGHAGMREAIEALQIGAEDFLTKPISPDHLLHSVKRAEEMIHLRTTERLFKQRLEQEVKEKTADIRTLAADLERQNRELEQKNKDLGVVNRLKDEFIQMMSHELNTPLNAISGFAQLLQQNATVVNDSTLNSSVSHILAGADRLHKTVASILTLADMTAGRMRPIYSTFSSDDLLDSVESDFPTLAQAAGNEETTLRCERPDQSFDLTADSGQLAKAVNYLLDNGIKFGGESLVLRASQEGEHACISISDNGNGMTEDEVAMALEPLRQVDGSMQRHIEGIGMGLALVKGIAKLHGGQLSIESEPGKGTTVTILLPKDGPAESPMESPAAS
ncbi:MAG: response regulator [Rhodospirillales bacterium]|nr:response regulator [Rhodospirillales bacterium]